MRKIVLCRVQPSFGQTKTISGVISDQNGLPPEKATVKAKGEKFSTVTDANDNIMFTK